MSKVCPIECHQTEIWTIECQYLGLVNDRHIRTRAMKKDLETRTYFTLNIIMDGVSL